MLKRAFSSSKPSNDIPSSTSTKPSASLSPTQTLSVHSSAKLKQSSANPKPSAVEESSIMSDLGTRIERNGVYILLWDQKQRKRWHWGLLIATSDKKGMLFHQTLSGLEWKYIVENKDVSISKSLLAVLKVGVADNFDDEETWRPYIKQCIRETEVEGELTCRTWVLAAVHHVADCGIIGMQPKWSDIGEIEKEAKRMAGKAKAFGTRFVMSSRLSIR